MGQGKTNKNKGSNAERYYAKAFRELGFDKCITSRFGSKLHDDTGIDLMNLPFNTQIKAGYQRGMNVSQVISDIKNRIKNTFVKEALEQKMATILIHKKQVQRGKRRQECDEIVSMSFEDFVKILKLKFDVNNSTTKTD